MKTPRFSPAPSQPAALALHPWVLLQHRRADPAPLATQRWVLVMPITDRAALTNKCTCLIIVGRMKSF